MVCVGYLTGGLCLIEILNSGEFITQSQGNRNVSGSNKSLGGTVA